ncbi:MAG TPA: tRNA uridine-5-carboxymethylaminomethyl(34) synthesis GTPase MnmE, partial [Rhodospirillaceae bacterium]|nr:tRNA uridine-5-carboxymethylaminomethyl(34) synthesis GTPase MnmE [Rhodospirillaceae bacterium]
LAAPIMAGGSNLFLTRARYRTALAGAVEALRRAMQEELSELAAEDVRLAAAAVGRITGRIDVEEVLDVIFRDFCIGK